MTNTAKTWETVDVNYCPICNQYWEFKQGHFNYITFSGNFHSVKVVCGNCRNVKVQLEQFKYWIDNVFGSDMMDITIYECLMTRVCELQKLLTFGEDAI